MLSQAKLFRWKNRFKLYLEKWLFKSKVEAACVMDIEIYTSRIKYDDEQRRTYSSFELWLPRSYFNEMVTRTL